MSDLLLSIIVPVYNAAATLPRMFSSLDRIAPTQRQRVQIIAVNDGSSDDSLALLRDIEQQSNHRLLVKDQENRGAAAARNTALSVAQGEWIYFLDADDELNFDPCAVLAMADDETCFAFTLEYRRGRRKLRMRPRMVDASNWADVLTAANPFQPSSLLFRRSCIDQPFREGIACVEDWLFWATNVQIFTKMRVCPSVVSAIIHVHGQNISAQFATAGLNRVRVAEILEERYAPALTRQQRNNLRIQREIGRLQQGQRLHFGTYLLLPCTPMLYLKLLIYTLAHAFGMQATPYR